VIVPDHEAMDVALISQSNFWVWGTLLALEMTDERDLLALVMMERFV
jgi:hypothetical protein